MRRKGWIWFVIFVLGASLPVACGKGKSSPTAPGVTSPAGPTDTPTNLNGSTSTFTYTFTSTLTPTETNVSGNTSTPSSYTPTYSSTATYTPTVTYSPTVTNTFTPIPTRTPTRTPTSAPVICLIPVQAGNTSAGGSLFAAGSGYILGSQVVLSDYAGIQSISVYLQNASGTLAVALYTDNGGAPQSLLTSGVASATNGWNTVAVSPAHCFAGNYWLMCQIQGSSQVAYFTGGSTRYVAYSWGTFPTVFPGGSSGATATLSMYMTYCNEPSWHDVGAAYVSPGSAQMPNLLFNGSVPNLAFGDCVNSCRATVMNYDGSWAHVGNADVSTDYALWLTFDIDGGTPYVAYRGNTGGKLNVKYLNGSFWADVGNPASLPSNVNRVSLDVDGGIPYVAYTGEDGQPSVLKYSTGSWTTVGTANFVPQSIGLVGLSVDAGTPYVVCSELNPIMTPTFNHDAQLYKHDGSAWVTVGGLINNANVQYFGRALTVTGGTPYLNCGWAILRYAGSAWTTFGGAAPGIGSSWSSFFVDGSTVYWTYPDTTQSNRITVRRSTGSSWSVVGYPAASSQPVTSGGTSTAVYNGVPSIAYQNGDSYKISVMSFY